MMQVPMLSPELEERFSSQVMCTYVYLVPGVQLLDFPPDQTCLRTKHSLFLCMNCKWLDVIQSPSHFFCKWKSAA